MAYLSKNVTFKFCFLRKLREKVFYQRILALVGTWNSYEEDIPLNRVRFADQSYVIIFDVDVQNQIPGQF